MSTKDARLSLREWVWLGCLSLLVTIAADIPRILSSVDPPAELVAVYPTVMAAEDYPQYRGSMREAIATGSWYSVDHFSSEPHRAIVLRPFYTFLGLVARATGQSPELAYGLASYSARVLLCVSIYLFVAVFHKSVGMRFLGLAITLLVSGLLGLLEVFSGVLPESFISTFEQRSERPEYNTFLLLFHHPHLIFACAFMLLTARAAVRSVGSSGGWLDTFLRAAGLAGLLFVISATNLFSVITVSAALAGLVLIVIVRGRRQLVGTLGSLRSILIGVPVGWLVAGSLVIWPAVSVFRQDPFWKATYGTPRGQETPAPEIMLFHLFFVVVFAVIGARSFFTQDAGAGRVLVAVWTVATLTLMAVPLDFQLRFAFGLQPVLAIVATSGVALLWRRATHSAAYLTLLVVLASTALATPLAYTRVFYLSATGDMLAHLRYRSAQEVEAAEWLRDHSGTGDVVLCAYPSGNYLGGQIAGRVFVGHSSGTLGLPEKLSSLDSFFKDSAPAETKRAFLLENRIDYVFFGPFEQAGAAAETRRMLAGLAPVFRRDGVVVYGVE